ncbi:MAG: hypothetical protein IPL09_02030 [Bacteroidetes bacterium]|nr:hypothetical protein [Bacteroidota bacterium]MBK7040451.1 hypothetical protein [Bacteroidota bacterium]MBK8328265.1 hypothetical protein [Bacteroidota bacterium]MBK9300220.1 hypothetical protein [Bacteroidota bacterium]
MNIGTQRFLPHFKLILIVSITLLIYGCNKSSTCLTPKVVALRGGFYYRDTVNTFKDSVQVNANLYFGTSLNYFINIKNTSKYFLSLAQNADSVTLYFQSDSTSTEPETIDSLLLHYTREPHFISTACGYETFFNITNISYSTNIIDTIIINQSAVNNDVNKENLKIVIKK